MIVAALAMLALSGPAKAEGNDPASQEPTDMRISVSFGDKAMTATLYDNPAARDLYAMLPLELTLEDYSRSEKIIRLPHRLSEDGAGRFDNEQAGDLLYYMPWGNLALFRAPYTYSSSVIRLGRFDEIGPLMIPGDFPVRIERLGS